MKSRAHIGLMGLALVACTYAGRAQWSPLPDANNAVCTADSAQHLPVMTGDGRGGAIIVWEDSREDATGSDIYAQRVSDLGVMRWARNGVAVCRFGAMQRRPCVVSDGNGGAIVVWDDTRNGSADIYAQRIDSTGSPEWAATGVPVCTAPWAQQYAGAIDDGRGGAIVVWQDSRNPGFAIYAQRITPAGTAAWTLNGVRVCGLQPTAVLPSIVSDGSGGAIIAWEDGRSPQAGGDIYAQHVDSSGAILWPSDGRAVCSAPGSQRSPRLAPDGAGGAIVAWQDFRSGANDPDIYAQHIDATGIVRWIGNGIGVCVASSAQSSPCIVSDSAGGAVIAWIDDRFTYAPRVFAQRLTSIGLQLWQPDGVDLCPVASCSDRLVLTADPAGGIVAVWTDLRSGTDNQNVYAQRLDAAGSIAWNTQAVLICGAHGMQTDPQILIANPGGAIVCWTDMRNEPTGGDIYASFLYNGGFIPVEFTGFSVREQQGQAQLTWSVEHESGSAGFEVQRAVDRAAWQLIGFVAASRDPVSASAYAFTDPVPLDRFAPAVLAYRVRQVDTDGTGRYSPVVVLASEGTAQSLRIAAWPNPSGGEATVSVTFPDEGRASVSLFDASGRRIRTLMRDRAVSRGGMAWPFGGTSLPAGVYFLTVEGTFGTAVERLVIRQ